MYFLNPEAFWAFSLILIPILIHLFNLRRVKKIYFSNLKFLTNVTQQRKSRTTLKKLLVLLTRILAIVFLVFAFSQPYLISEESKGPVASPVIYLDNSLSLQRTDESGNLLLLNSVSSVSGLLNSLPKGLNVGLITNDERVLKWDVREEVAEKVLETDYANHVTTLDQVYPKIKQLQAQYFYVFSDFQKSTSSGLEAIIEDTTIRTTLYKLQSPIERNLYVDSVYLNEPLSISSDSKLNIVINNTDSEPVSDLLVKLFKEDTQLASFTVNIGPKTSHSLLLDLGVGVNVTGEYRIEIDDSPVVFDNKFHFSINKSEKPSVVILYDDFDNRFLQRVFNADYFTLSTESVTNASFQNVMNADLLILDHLESIPDWLNSQLSQLKGKVLVCPGDQVSLGSYNSILGFTIKKLDSAKTTGLASNSLNNPFFKDVFTERNDRLSLPDVEVEYEVQGYYEPVLVTDAGLPFLLKNENIYFIASGLESNEGAFPKHAIFVPVMYKLAQREELNKLYFRMGRDVIRIRQDSISRERLIELKNQNNSFLPSTRFTDEGLMIEIPEVLDNPGLYYLTMDDDTLRSVAINYAKTESEIGTFSGEELQKLTSGYSHVNVQEIVNVQEFSEQRSNDGDSDSLWKYALFLALFFLISEIILLRFI